MTGPGEERTIEVSFVIVHYRTPEVLARCIRSIEAARPAFAYEALVVDNAPLDDAAERLAAEHPAVRVLRNEKNVGFGRGVNRGLREARGRFFLVLNPDVEVRPGSVEELLAEMERTPSAGIVAPKLLYPDGTLQLSCRTFYTFPVFLLRRTFLGKLRPNHRLLREHLMLDDDHATTRPVDWCLGASLLVRRAAVEDVGPMDERFFLYFEDVDWCYRMASRGWKVLYHPAAEMIHRYERMSARRPGKGLWIHLASTFRYYEKWSFLLYWLKRRSRTIRKGVLVLSDLLAINTAFVVAYVGRNLAGPLFSNPTFGFGRYGRFLVFANVVALLALALAGMYRSRRREEAGEQLLGAIRAILATGLVTMAATFLFFAPVYSRAVIGLFLPLSLLLVLAFRFAIFRTQGSIRSRRIQLHRIGLLAPQDDVVELERRLSLHPDLGMELLPLASRAAVLESRSGGKPEEVGEAVVLWVQDERVAEVVLYEDWPGGDTERVAEDLNRAGIPVRLVPRARRALHLGARMGDFLGVPALQVSGMGGPARSWEKRLFDALAALLLLPVLLLPFLIGLAISGARGGAIETREVIGRRGKRLRPRRLPGNRPRGALFTLIREFPTLLLCIRGDWSFVGVVPLEERDRARLPEGYLRFPPDAAPGWATLAGDPTGRDLEELCAINQEYAGRWSLALDLEILMRKLRGSGR
ncbi:MAG: glycosyltransferase [Candidatus Eisenbacteria bacterium]|nr:glycosyltransferase [Candidatus Latescibacterota bacterium]MBD3302288.1 glycosyltransferase [Candidatus Eisenbacteria bacterium]